MKWIRRAVVVTSLLIGVGIAIALGVWWSAHTAFGEQPNGDRVASFESSPQWQGGTFVNPLPRVDQAIGSTVLDFFWGRSNNRIPNDQIETVGLKRSDFDERAPLRVTWLGHSSLIVEIDGARLLIDPVWGERASPFTFAGPKRFYEPPLALDELPEIDAIVISHDHYDHLDFPTVQQLVSNDFQWLVPLGVGSHLEYWGVPAERIRELDWWEETSVASVRLVCTPSRHFSGRVIGGQNSTLWASWSLIGPTHRAFYSGDTALHPELKTIGERFGPFDLTMIEVGAYNQAWADVHLGPEQAVLAHQLVRGALMIPVHWGLFDLALHGWTEPVERLELAASALGIALAIPRPGGSVTPEQGAFSSRFWPSIPWQTVEEAPAWSSSVAALQQPLRGEQFDADQRD